jgi:hypothetical protein
VVAVAAASSVVATLLTGCDTKVGAAGIVSGDRISETTVSGYVTPQAQTIQLTTGQKLAPRSFVLQSLIGSRVAEQVLAANGATPSEAAINEAEQAALGQGSEEQLVQALTTRGFKASFEPVYLRTVALGQLLAKVPGITNQQELQSALTKANVTVQVNPRYGTWNASQFALDSDLAANLPDFLKVSGGSAAATPTPTPTG